LQIMALIVMNTVYFAWYVACRPHETKERTRLEIFNECIIQMITYHLIAFSDLVVDSEGKFIMGYSYIGFVLLLVASNCTVMVGREVERLQRMRVLQSKRKEW